jgi:acetyl-CoA carboxylase biotin carboxyl carrier protein
MALSDEDVREILRIIDESELAELHIETEGFSLHVRKDGVDAEASERPRVRPAPQRGTVRHSPGASDALVPAPAADAESGGVVSIPAPMLGTFYRAEGPGKPPFVEVGSRVEPDTIVCIIEVMKMMNSVPAGVAGTVAEVLPDNAELVEYGQPLFRVRPA